MIWGGVIGVALAVGLTPAAASAEPPFNKSFADNDLVFITPEDPTSFGCVHFVGEDLRQVWRKLHSPSDTPNKRGRIPMLLFEARFTDGVTTEIWAHPELADSAEGYVHDVAKAMGHLPTFLRTPIEHVVIGVSGDHAFAIPPMGQIGMYATNIDERRDANDLEELMFHEAIHVAMDFSLNRYPTWKAAQAADPEAISAYARKGMAHEDIAESAIFAYTMIMTPGRLPDEVVQNVMDVMPNRFDVLKTVFDADAPRFEQVAPAMPCP